LKRHIARTLDRLADRYINKVVRRVPFTRPRGDSFDVLEIAFLEAAKETADFWRKNMITAGAFGDSRDLLRHAIGLVTVDGLFLEFGVASGSSISHIAELSKQRIFGFDSFEGLPETWRTGYPSGAFATLTPKVSANVSLVKGLFADTLPGFLESHAAPIAFLHVDCDLYASTKCVFDRLGERIGPGCVIVFDEYFNYPGWQEHEHKAFMEFVGQRRVRLRYDSFVPSHQQVCVVVEGAATTN
jgi:hypothetical protein